MRKSIKQQDNSKLKKLKLSQAKAIARFKKIKKEIEKIEEGINDMTAKKYASFWNNTINKTYSSFMLDKLFYFKIKEVNIHKNIERVVLTTSIIFSNDSIFSTHCFNFNIRDINMTEHKFKKVFSVEWNKAIELLKDNLNNLKEKK